VRLVCLIVRDALPCPQVGDNRHLVTGENGLGTLCQRVWAPGDGRAAPAEPLPPDLRGRHPIPMFAMYQFDISIRPFAQMIYLDARACPAATPDV